MRRFLSGKKSAASGGGSAERKLKPLWKCPKCGHKFVNRNIWHSCGRFKLSDHFKGKAPAVRKAFDAFVELAKKNGPLTVYAQKTRIVIQGRVRFAGGVTRKNFLDANLWLKRRAEHPRLIRVEDFGKIGCVHHFELRSPNDLDGGLAELMAEAYRVGQQEHIYGSVGPAEA